jgi:anti-sigma factor RsiW
MRAQGTSGTRPPEPPDQELWRRSQEIDATPDEAEFLLDLAAFADNRLDDDDTARVAMLLALDAGAAADVAAARALAGVAMIAADESVIARAEALIGEGRPEAVLIAFPARGKSVRSWYGTASWSGLAAAIVLAGWLGFDLGSGLSGPPPLSHLTDETSASELLDPGPQLLRDFTENSQI